MDTITIPKKLAQKGDLVVVPRKEYEELLRTHKKHKGFYEKLDTNLDMAIDSYRKGRTVGPFTSVASLKKSLQK